MTRPARCGPLAPAALALLASACAPPAELAVVATRDLGPLETLDVVKARDGGYSVRFGDRSVWLYGDTILAVEGEDGESWRDNTFSWTTDLDARDGITGFQEPVDAYGAPREFFPETDDEAAFNAAHRGDDCIEPCGAREVLWPMAAVEDPERARVLAFYMKIYGEPGDWNFYPMGYGVAVWEDPDAEPTRPEVAPSADEPTLLFTEEDLNFGSAALVVGDQLYAYACESRHGSWDKPCLLARVALADALERGSWTFWDGDGFVPDVEDAEPVVDGNSQMTVHWNAHLERYVAVHVDGIWDDLVFRTAPEPEGPWSRAEHAFTAEPAVEGFVYCGLAHPEHSRDGGRYEYVSYFRATGDWTGEVRVVEVEVRPP